MQYRMIFSIFQMDDRVKTSSVGRALDCSAGGRGFDSRYRTNTHYLNNWEKKVLPFPYKRVDLRVARMIK